MFIGSKRVAAFAAAGLRIELDILRRRRCDEHVGGVVASDLGGVREGVAAVAHVDALGHDDDGRVVHTRRTRKDESGGEVMLPCESDATAIAPSRPSARRPCRSRCTCPSAELGFTCSTKRERQCAGR